MAKKKRQPKALVVGDVATAYALIPSKAFPSLFHLAKLKIKGDRVVKMETDTEDFRGMKLAKLQADAMRDV